MCSRCLGGCERRLFPGRTVLSASSPDRPCPAALPCAPTRPTRGMFGFWIRQVVLHRISLLRASGETFKRRVFGALGGEERLSPGQTVQSASSLARPRPAAPPCAPTRPARGTYVRVWDSTSELSVSVDFKNRTYHGFV